MLPAFVSLQSALPTQLDGLLPAEPSSGGVPTLGSPSHAHSALPA
jgi:hypothetical protein